MESLRITMASINLAADHRRAVKAQADTTAIYDSMETLDAKIVEYTNQIESMVVKPSHKDLTDPESVTAYRMRGYTRVRLARQVTVNTLLEILWFSLIPIH